MDQWDEVNDVARGLALARRQASAKPQAANRYFFARIVIVCSSV